MSSKKTGDDEMVEESWKIALEHARSMFVYHAGQRHASLNYYFAVLGAFVAGLVALFSADSLWTAPNPVGRTIARYLGVAGFLMTVFFYLLDLRNQRLVDCDEMLIKEVEHKLALRYRHIENFEIIKGSDKYCRFISYRWIVPFILGVFTALWFGAFCLAGRFPLHSAPPAGPPSMQAPR